jgi:hypothetical protein
LVYLIEKLDQHRFPFKLTISFSRPIRSYEHDEFIEKTLKSMEIKNKTDILFASHRERYEEVLSREWPVKILIKFVLFLLALLAVIIPLGFIGFSLRETIGVLPAFIVFSAVGVALVSMLIYKSLILYFQALSDVVSKEKDEETKKIAQEVIEFTRDFLNQRKLDPREFNIVLRHNDYDGLIYERKNDGFFAYLKVNR